jgi:D-alanine-D-alanine ligase
MKIGLSYDLKEAVDPGQAPPEDALEEYDSKETVEALKSAIEARGHVVVKLGGGREFLNHILHEKVDFVFNISEGRGNYRGREAQVPSVLEMLDIPYSGADPQCLAVCLDKNLTKKIVSWDGIHTPVWRTVDRSQLNNMDWQTLPYPGFVKPVWEGSSKGIRLNSLCRDPQQMETVVTGLLQRYNQPVLIEEFIPGQEVTVGMVGNNPPRVVGVMRVIPRKTDRNFVYSLEVKRDYENLVDYECPAKIKKTTLEQIREFSLRAFQVLECRDFARLDFRIRPNGAVYFLEANPLAGLNPKSSDLVIMAGLIGVSYQDLIGSILESALERYPQCTSK